MGSAEVTIIIPNLNGGDYIAECLDSVANQTIAHDLIVVDDGSTDVSLSVLRKRAEAGELTLIEHGENKGFAAAVNTGIRAADTPYVILFNNDAKADQAFAEELLRTVKKNGKIFSVSAKMLQMKHPELIDDCGDYYCALGWAFSPGRDKNETFYNRRVRVTSACGGAAIYDRKIIEELGYFDEAHFCYLEDVDIGLRAGRAGYINLYEPAAVMYHAASATSGSRYNAFKIKLTVANSLYIIYKNQPLWMIILNLPFLVTGFSVKTLFYIMKGQIRPCLAGYQEGLKKIENAKNKRPAASPAGIGRDLKLYFELLGNMVRRLKG